MLNNMTLSTTAITLILVMDPLGNIPVFLSVLKKFDPKQQRQIILREVLIAFVVLTLFLFFGRYIMHGLNLTADALSIAGGVILFLIALRMIFPSDANDMFMNQDEEPFIVPLAVPLTAGPSALAMVLLFASRDPSATWEVFGAVVIATVIFLAVVLCAPYLMRILGRRGLIAMERLMGMILTTVAVQMFLNGMQHYFKAH